MVINDVDSTNLKVLLNLIQAYEGEFSSITKKIPGPDGLFKLDTTIDEYHPAFLLFNGESPIGFCIKTTFEGIHDIAEFYIVPSCRSKNLGSWFAEQIFKKYSGSWQVRQIAGADKAIKFWRKAISAFTDGDFTESKVKDEYWGEVTRQIFISKVK